MPIDRSAAILLGVSSLPSPYGIGTLGQTAYDFVDFLSAAGHSLCTIALVLPRGNSVQCAVKRHHTCLILERKSPCNLPIIPTH